ncbi:unnamed protein product [Ectocarpus sp. CCAP 1310/34]|nr:unnamed protein product [Ectocarpus sp. CCAP 1310/34]
MWDSENCIHRRAKDIDNPIND